MKPDRTYLLLLFFPLLIYTIFWVIPSFSTIVYSFFNLVPLSGGGFRFDYVGLANFDRLVRDEVFYLSLRNNFIFLIFIVIIRNVIAILLAVVMFQGGLRAKNMFNVLLFMPIALSPYMIGLMFRFMFDPVVGLVGQYLTGTINVLAPDVMAYTLSGIETWRTYALPLVIFLAGMTSIPSEILDAASIDGAKGFERLRDITLPLLKPVITIVIVLSVIDSFTVFDIWLGMYGQASGIPFADNVVTTYIFNVAFWTGNLGYGSSLSAVLLLIEGFISIFYLSRMGLLQWKSQK